MRGVCLLVLCCLTLACTEEDAPPAPDPAKRSCKVDSLPGGQRKQAVVGGSATHDPKVMKLTPGQRKAIGSMRLDIPGFQQQYGSATLVADRLVLTAGHVGVDYERWDGDPATVADKRFKPELLKFLVGEDHKKPDKVFSVKEIIVHPLFQTHVLVEHDLSLLLLTESASEAVPGIEPIPVNLAPMDASMVGATVFAGGYGSLTCQTFKYSPQRYWASQVISRVQDSDLGHKDTGKGQFTNGDSGAGIFMSFADGVTRQVGVVSAHVDSACKETQGSRLDAHAAWFRQVLPRGCGPVTAAGSCAGGKAVYCDSGRVVRQECAASGKVCGPDTCGLNRCVAAPATPAPECQGLDYFGQCSADGVLRWCLGGKLRQRDCRALGGACVKSADPLVGYTCSGDGAGSGGGDGGADAGLPDAAAPTATCAKLDACLMAIADGNDVWAVRACLFKASYKIKKTWTDYYTCKVCTVTSSIYACDKTHPGYLKCTASCQDFESAQCKACIKPLCKTHEDLCLKQ